MAIVAFTDIVSVVLVLVVMFVLDIFGFITSIGTFYVAASVLGIFVTAWVFFNHQVITQIAYNSNTGTFVNNPSDPNIIVAILSVCTVMSALLIIYEKYK